MAAEIGATAEATARSAGRWGRPFGRTGLVASALGFGCYRVSPDQPVHREAMLHALRARHVNLIDVSTNYGGGAAERLVGDVLAEVPREGVIVVSKVGYQQGELLDGLLAEERAHGPLPYRIGRFGERHWHSIDPRLVERGLDTSLARMRIARLDAMLLHNPEYLLRDPAVAHLDLAARRADFYGQVTEAFRVLEARVRAGQLGGYGVSSNTIGDDPEDPGSTQLEAFLAAAEAAGGPGHAFRVVQLPLNLAERGPVTRYRGAPSVLERCAAAGLAVMVNRPLNAIIGDRLVRLADTGQPDPERDRLLADAPGPGTLSRRAISWVVGQPGVTTTLVGMRTPAYVDDAAAIYPGGPS